MSYVGGENVRSGIVWGKMSGGICPREMGKSEKCLAPAHIMQAFALPLWVMSFLGFCPMDFIRRHCLSVIGHIARLTQGTPAHNALHCQVGLPSGRSLGRDWRRRPGRPRTR